MTFMQEDLKRTFIRAQDETGKWGSVSLADVTDAQFGEWARGRMAIEGNPDEAWTAKERTDFCRFLELHQGELVKLVKESSDG